MSGVGAAPAANVDPAEIARFSALADEWWDPQGPSRALHEINPCRLDFVARHAVLAGARTLDIGCGGGLLTEGLAAAGAHALGIDASEAVIAAAVDHATQTRSNARYAAVTAEAHAAAAPEPYSVITCMELLEHLPDPGSLLRACANLLSPSGDLFLSTINRTPRAWGTTILAAEHLLRLLPRGTHDYRRFIRPSELSAWLRDAGFELVHLAGMRYLPFSRRAELSRDVGVNYLVHARLRA